MAFSEVAFSDGAGEGPRTGRGRRPKRYTVARPERKAANREVHKQYAAASVRARYGPLGHPAPVTVRRLGDV